MSPINPEPCTTWSYRLQHLSTDLSERRQINGSVRGRIGYTLCGQAGESGASLRAAGWRVIAERPARKGWSTPSRPREDKRTDGIPRTLWEAS